MDTKVEVLLSQKSFHRYPTVNISVNEQTQNLTINCDTWVTFNLDLSQNEQVTLSIEHYGKTDRDCVPFKDLDTAVIIKTVRLNGLSDPKFIWKGIFRPAYPDHYEPKVAELTNTTYLGFNGVWTLDMTVPLFTWIHKILNFGWIYE